ncbi:polysaccharide biosynthesis protein [Alishewanella agri BL06]|uniref:Polysaccharide biosynthesis protein n=1 Tax=Alishewanella agri BL06 TaxID=1195246 RepID=I8UAS8_9ALTE|nr:oligosaccharide flippase family protein [Alishewanella agri]EIW90356.1 polysaccharide biosynthesis protein [Alishewanella agri BL06]
MSNVRSSILFSFAGKYGSKLINLVSTIFIARLLTPTEIGTFAIASSVVMILAEIRLLGAAAYLVREESIDELKIRRAYGITYLMCWGLASILIVGSGFIADFFNQRELQGVFLILAASFFLAPFISIPNAILVRNYRFKQVTIIDLVALIIQLVATLWLISFEFGFYALAWGQLVAMLTRMIFSLYFTRQIRVYAPCFRGMGEIARLGVYTSAANIVRRIHYTISDIVIGKMGTAAEVGVFSRGMGFVDFISKSVLDGVGSVAQPYMSDLKRRGNDLGQAYIKATALLCSLVWPVLVVAGFAALPAIRLLFGNQWDNAAPIASALSFWMCIKVISFFSPPLLIAVGREAVMFKRDVLLFVLLAGSLILSYPMGLTTMALTFILNGLVEVCITLLLVRVTVQVSIKACLISLFKPMLLSLGCLGASTILDYLYPFSSGSPLVIFLLLTFVMPPIWLLLSRWLKLQIYTEATKILLAAMKRIAR